MPARKTRATSFRKHVWISVRETLAYLPGEGHGVLIARDWVVTAACATTWRPIHKLTINGALCGVERVIIHPGYKKPPKEMQSGDAAPLMAFLTGSDDIALIKLPHAVSGVTPISVYKGSDENGKVVELSAQGQPETAWSVNIRHRLIAANCVVAKRGSQVPMNVG